VQDGGAGGVRADHDDDRCLKLYQFGFHAGQPVELAICKLVIDCDIAGVDAAGFGETLSEGGVDAPIGASRATVQECQQRQHLPLRTRRWWF
jgi:hypothetical protein